MKAPKNFYNTVDQTKLGIDDLFTRTAENESDIAALETVVGDDTTGLVKSVSDLETVVGDLDGGLVKDVHDLQDDSEHYHDDIADLKTADITLGLRIDDLRDDVEPHLYYDVNATSSDSPSAFNLTFAKPVNEIITDVKNSGRVPRLCITATQAGHKECHNVFSFSDTKIVFYTLGMRGPNNDVFYDYWTLESSNTTTAVSGASKKLT